MSNKYICTTCLRHLRRQLPSNRPLPSQPSRLFSISSAYRQKGSPSNTYTRPSPPSPPKEGQESQTIRKGLSPSLAESVANAIRYTAPNLAEPYVAYGATEILVRECARVADYSISQEQRMVSDEDGAVQVGEGHGWWYEKFGLEATFNTWAQITFLHMWMLTVRLRTFPADNAPVWHQQLVDHFFYLSEEKMVVAHNIASRHVRNNYLKDLFAQWRGLTVGYDQGLIEGDAALAAAIWRNVCGQNENVDLVGLAQATSYVRSVIKGLESMEDGDIAAGQVVFEDPAGERDAVRTKSVLWTRVTDSGNAIPSKATGATGPAKSNANKNPNKAAEKKSNTAPN